MSAIKSKNMWLTTKDNPFNFWLQNEDWLWWDLLMGYNTNARIMRKAPTSDENLTEFENDELINVAINEILDEDKGENYVLTFEDGTTVADV